MRQIGLAVANYQATHGHYPPPFTVDGNGNRLHSWRVLLLPYLEEDGLYNKIKLDEPWNSVENQKLALRMPSVYCFHGQTSETSITNYLAVVGQSTAWPTSGQRVPADFTDGPGKTILVVENNGLAVNWMEPRDLEFDTFPREVPHPKGISSQYLNAAVVMADARLTELQEQLTPEILNALLTIDGGEDLSEAREGWQLLEDGTERLLDETESPGGS